MDFLFELLGNPSVGDWMKSVAQAETTKMTLAFIIAARLHRGWVRTDINVQVKSITDSLNNLANKLTQDIGKHSERIDNLANRVENLEEKTKPKS